MLIIEIIAPAFAVCNAYGAGLTDWNVASTYAKICIFVFAAWAGNDVSCMLLLNALVNIPCLGHTLPFLQCPCLTLWKEPQQRGGTEWSCWHFALFALALCVALYALLSLPCPACLRPTRCSRSVRSQQLSSNCS